MTLSKCFRMNETTRPANCVWARERCAKTIESWLVETASYDAIYGNELLVVAHNLRHKSYDASYRSTTNSSVARQMQVMAQVMDFTVSRLKYVIRLMRCPKHGATGVAHPRCAQIMEVDCLTVRGQIYLHPACTLDSTKWSLNPRGLSIHRKGDKITSSSTVTKFMVR